MRIGLVVLRSQTKNRIAKTRWQRGGVILGSGTAASGLRVLG